MPSEWHEVLSERNRTSKTKQLFEDGQPTNKYSWDGMVGTSLHYEGGGTYVGANELWFTIRDSVFYP